MTTKHASSIPRLFANKSIFITGVTGMLGKVLVEKMLRTTPQIRVIYVLVRPSNGKNAQERVEEELYKSRIWERLLETPTTQGGFNGNKKALDTFLRQKIVAVDGDLLKGILPPDSDSPDPPPAIFGLSPQWQDRLAREGVDIVFHNAATVNFDEQIDMAIRLNVLAPLKMMELAKQWRCRAYVHVSTAYVVSHHKTKYFSPERLDVSPKGLNPDKLIAKVLELSKRVANKTKEKKKIILDRAATTLNGAFPNTYTLTKHIAELKVVEQNKRLQLPMCIVRPSIIGASLREPVPGWIDTLSAAAAVFTAGSLGMLNLLPGNPNGVGDIIPVDLVVNHMLLRCSEVLSRAIPCGKDSKGVHHMPISHCATSTMNPVKWRSCEVVKESFVYDNSIHQRGKISYRMLENQNQFNLEWFLRFTAPLALYRTGATLLNASSHMAEADKLDKAIKQGERICELFKAFTTKEYFYETSTIQGWVQASQSDMTAHGRHPNRYVPANNPFNVDSREIVWNTYLHCFAYGIRRYILSEDMTDFPTETLLHNDMQLTTLNIRDWDHDHHRISFPSLFPDYTWTYTHSRKPGYTQRGIFGTILGWTGWEENKSHQATQIARRVERTKKDMEALVLSSDSVRSATQVYDRLLATTTTTTAAAATGLDSGGLRMAEKMIQHMASNMDIAKARPGAYLLRKAWRSMYDSVNVDEVGLGRVRTLLDGTAQGQLGGVLSRLSTPSR